MAAITSITPINSYVRPPLSHRDVEHLEITEDNEIQYRVLTLHKVEQFLANASLITFLCDVPAEDIPKDQWGAGLVIRYDSKRKILGIKSACSNSRDKVNSCSYVVDSIAKFILSRTSKSADEFADLDEWASKLSDVSTAIVTMPAVNARGRKFLINSDYAEWYEDNEDLIQELESFENGGRSIVSQRLGAIETLTRLIEEYLTPSIFVPTVK